MIFCCAFLVRYKRLKTVQGSSPSRIQHRPAIWVIIHHIFLLYTSLHILETILTADILLVIHILYHYSTLNIYQRYGF